MSIEKRSLKGQIRLILKMMQILAEKELNFKQIAEELAVQERTVSKYAELLYDLGFADIEIRGPNKIVKLTEKGRCIVKCLG
ncbi:HTH domain protein [Pyrodictium delaneyi]|uniref:HTH domain protein n=1 Tax=Pyrodictium delaneyi TaxID=1273541 RepID=A0A0N7JCQ6_9CREN|nr:HTH domain-containing protein [Pyrodictium delaneyi]ALL00057.1 HTH domain protein [Pyrodictium delaneyi]